MAHIWMVSWQDISMEHQPHTHLARCVNRQSTSLSSILMMVGSGPHCLSLDNYNINKDDDSPNHTWLLLEPSNT